MAHSSPRRGVLAWLPVIVLCVLVSGGGTAVAQPTAPISYTSTVTPTLTPAPAWPNDGAVDHPVASTGCGKPSAVTPGTTAEQTMAVDPATDEGYRTRTYWIHVPRGYDPGRPIPLVLAFHGGGGTAVGAESGTGFSPFGDRHSFLVVYPQGLPFSDLGAGYTTWAATGPLDTIAHGVDDLLFVSNLLDVVQRQYCVDPTRIYANGFSAGGAMTAFLTCGLTGRIAAFAPMSGDAYQFKGGCYPTHPTSIVEFHGADDPAELYAGIPAREDPDWRRMGVLEWLTAWARRDRCAAGPTPFLRSSTVLGEEWTGCQSGTTVDHYRIAGLGHAWPPPIAGQSVLDVMWSFFQAHPLVTA
jgi:polyhydroxybutyrate depolymerase